MNLYVAACPYTATLEIASRFRISPRASVENIRKLLFRSEASQLIPNIESERNGVEKLVFEVQETVKKIKTSFFRFVELRQTLA